MRLLVTSLPDLRRINYQRYHHVLAHLSKQHEIDVYAISSNLPELKDGDVENTLSRVNFRYVATRKHPAWQELAMARLIPESSGYDVVLNFHSIAGGRRVARGGAPMVFDLCDDLVDWMSSSPRLPRSIRPLARWFSASEMQKTIAQAHSVIASVPGLARKYDIPTDKLTIIPNGVDPAHFVDRGRGLRHQLGIPQDKMVAAFVGYLGPWVDLGPWLDALAKASDPRLHLLIVGGGETLPYWRERARCLSLEAAVTFTGNVPYLEVPKYMSAADVCILPFDDSQVSAYALPLKIFEYMACGRPVIATPLPTVQDAVGARVQYGRSAPEILAALQSVNSGTLSENRKFVEEQYAWSGLCARYERVLEAAHG